MPSPGGIDNPFDWSLGDTFGLPSFELFKTNAVSTAVDLSDGQLPDIGDSGSGTAAIQVCETLPPLPTSPISPPASGAELSKLVEPSAATTVTEGGNTQTDTQAASVGTQLPPAELVALVAGMPGLPVSLVAQLIPGPAGDAARHEHLVAVARAAQQLAEDRVLRAVEETMAAGRTGEEAVQAVRLALTLGRRGIFGDN